MTGEAVPFALPLYTIVTTTADTPSFPEEKGSHRPAVVTGLHAQGP